MGEDLERKRRRNEKRKRDVELQNHLMKRTLFSGSPEAYTTYFRCESGKNGTALEAGDPLLIRDNARGRVEILKSGLSIGFMEKEDAAGLRAILAKERRAAGVCLGEVVQLPGADHSFQIKIRPINPGRATAAKSDADSETK